LNNNIKFSCTSFTDRYLLYS